MDNKKVFIGNLDFSATEAELKSLLSGFGTVASIKLRQKKGCAFFEMENSEDAARVVQQLNGTKHRGREIRLSFYMKARKARIVSTRTYKERGVSLSNHRKETSTKPGKDLIQEQFSSPGRQVADSRKPSLSRSQKSKSGYKPRERSTGSESRPFKSSSRERTGSARPLKRPWSAEKPSYSGRATSDSRKPDTARSPQPQSRYKPSERTSASESRPFKSSSRQRPAASGPQKKEWSPKRPSRPSVKTEDKRVGRPERNKALGDRSRDSSKPRSANGYQNRSGKSSQAGAAKGRTSAGSTSSKPRVNFAGRSKPLKRDR